MQSMTGFARADASHAGCAIAWELKSVNGKSADIRLRLPPGLERIEQAVRTAVQRHFSRGNFTCTLSVSRGEEAVVPVINETILKDLANRAMKISEQYGCAAPTADGLLALRGVLEIPSPHEDPDESAALDAAILACLDLALERLEAARRDEGRALAGVLAERVQRIEELTNEAEADPSRDAVAIRERLKQQLQLLMDASSQLDENQLYQEAALLATRADIREELDRLKAHVASARALLRGAGAVGRKLDFLAQEFNREANTLCSKSNSAAVTSIGLELKAVVDQFREQVQNLE